MPEEKNLKQSTDPEKTINKALFFLRLRLREGCKQEP